MQTTETAITGSETHDDCARPYDALVEFYHAFNTGDMGLMRANWLHAEAASMSNPLGGLKRGWDDLQQVYSRIFDGPADVYVEFHDYSIQQSDGMFCAVGRERGYFRSGGEEIRLAIRTSRIYRWADGRWRQLHHHGSIDDPQLLQRYQAAVAGA